MNTTQGRDITGERFGILLVIERAGRGPQGHVLWRCQCGCGKEHVATGSHLRDGDCTSCGCERARKLGDRRRTHGRSRRGGGEYKIWCGIIERCENLKHPAYPNYGGRGITFHGPWRRDFMAFLAAVGPRPSANHTIDRIDVNRGYEPGNVRWATWLEQGGNKRSVRQFAFEGQTACIAEWSRRLGVPYLRLYNRLVRKGEPAAQVLAEERLTPVAKDARSAAALPEG